MPKIIHTADIHLDAPFSLFDVQKAQVRKNELRGTFSSLILLAKTEKADIMILAGDLFDSGFVTKETTSLLISQFASVPECRFVIVPGNHDFISSRSPYKKELFPPNVYIFEDERISKISFDEIGVDVYGFAYTSERYTENPLTAPLMLDRRKINILAAHCDLYGKSDCCPLTPADLARSGFDYAALGHIHKGGDVKLAGGTYYAYSGCPEGRSFDECGIKGVILCEMNKDSGKLVRVKLCGRISPEAALSPEKLSAQMFGVFYLEIQNDTVPLLNDEELKNDISIRGAFFRELLPMLESENDEERRTAAAALRYGLDALDGEDVVDF